MCETLTALSQAESERTLADSIAIGGLKGRHRKKSEGATTHVATIAAK